VKLIAHNERCSGCQACLLACSLENHREMTTAKAALAVEGRFPAPGTYAVRLCDQCGECAEACPEAAIHLENGVYMIQAEECSGCMTCVAVCPQEVMFEHPAMAVPIKCTLCGACVAACPREALALTPG
jgi:ferredoxin